MYQQLLPRDYGVAEAKIEISEHWLAMNLYSTAIGG
jgi:hypothetical protein